MHFEESRGARFVGGQAWYAMFTHFEESRGAPDEQLTVVFVDFYDFNGFACILMDLHAF